MPLQFILVGSFANPAIKRVAWLMLTVLISVGTAYASSNPRSRGATDVLRVANRNSNSRYFATGLHHGGVHRGIPSCTGSGCITLLGYTVTVLPDGPDPGTLPSVPADEWAVRVRCVVWDRALLGSTYRVSTFDTDTCSEPDAADWRIPTIADEDDVLELRIVGFPGSAFRAGPPRLAAPPRTSEYRLH